MVFCAFIIFVHKHIMLLDFILDYNEILIMNFDGASLKASKFDRFLC
jgi:hypothetical protein